MFIRDILGTGTLRLWNPCQTVLRWITLCSPKWTQTSHPPTSASRVLGLEPCTPMPGLQAFFNNQSY